MVKLSRRDKWWIPHGPRVICCLRPHFDGKKNANHLHFDAWSPWPKVAACSEVEQGQERDPPAPLHHAASRWLRNGKIEHVSSVHLAPWHLKIEQTRILKNANMCKTSLDSAKINLLNGWSTCNPNNGHLRDGTGNQKRKEIEGHGWDPSDVSWQHWCHSLSAASCAPFYMGLSQRVWVYMDILQSEPANGKQVGEALGFGCHIIRQPQLQCQR